MAGDNTFNVRGTAGQTPSLNIQTDSATAKPNTGFLTLAGNEHLLQSNTQPVPHSPDIEFSNLTRSTLKKGSADESDRMSIASTTGEPRDRTSSNVSIQSVTGNTGDLLQPLRDRTVRTVRDESAAFGTAIGVTGGAVLGALKFVAIGAAIGTAVMPGIGTAVGAVIGGLVGVFGGGLVGGGVGAAAGHFVGKSRAAKINVESVMKDYAPGTARFDKVAKNAGITDDPFDKQDRKRIEDGLKKAIQIRIDTGEPFGREFVETALTSLMEISARKDLKDTEKADLTEKFLLQLDFPGRATVPMMRATAAALLGIYNDQDLTREEQTGAAEQFSDQLELRYHEESDVSSLETILLAQRYVTFAKTIKQVR